MVRHLIAALAGAALLVCAWGTTSRAQNALTSSSIPQFVYDATWPKLPLPKGWIIGNVIGVAIDSRDHVWIVHRPATITQQERGAGFGVPTADCCFPAPPVIEFDATGNVVQAWGGPAPGYKWVDSEHGLFVDHKNNVWVGNNQRPHLLKFTRDGKYLLTIGTPGAKPPSSNDPKILGGPAPWVHPKTNELFVTDGYVNRRIIVFDADTGQYKRMWGAYGGKPDDSVPWTFNPEGTDKPPSKQFQTVTGVAVSNDDLVYAADRSNNRIQVFRLDGTFVREGFLLPKTPRGTVDTLSFSADKAQQFIFNADPRNMRVWIIRRSDLQPLGWFGSGGHFGGAFNSPAYVVTDTKGNLYVGEGQDGKRIQKFTYKGMSR